MRVAVLALSLTAALGLLVLGSASAARAATPEGRASARQHLARAEELKKQGKLAAACAELEEVERLDSKLPTLLDLAECTESLGKLVEAQDKWALARDRAKHDEKPQSRARAEAKLADLQKRVPRLTLQLAAGAPPGAQVLRDDAPLEATSLGSALPTNPGEHVIVVKLVGHDDAKYTVKLAEGDNQTLPVAVGPASAVQVASSSAAPALPSPAPALPTVAAPAPPSEPPPAAGWWTGPRKAGVIAGAVGLVAVGGGSALCVVASSDAGGHVDQRLALGGLSIVTGGALLVSGLVLLASAPRDEAAQHARMRVTPTLMVARNATVLGAVGEF